MGVTEDFRALMAGPERELALDLAAALIAAHANRSVEPNVVLSQLDRLADACPEPSVEELCRHLFSTVGFAGNRAEYDDPRNSLLDQVLSRRRGIPITLAVVVLEVGRRLGLTLDGIGMPGHFLVGLADGDYLDPFAGGRRLDTAGCRAQFHVVVGADAPWEESYLHPVSGHAIVARVLANLRRVYALAEDLASLCWVLRLRAMVPGVDRTEPLRLASVLTALGRFDEAAQAVEQVASTAIADEADTLRDRAVRLRARLN